tara:strand:- start:290 stop:556 length:267 start_codon:yes stop_codon:yes gene_type:complete
MMNKRMSDSKLTKLSEDLTKGIRKLENQYDHLLQGSSDVITQNKEYQRQIANQKALIAQLSSEISMLRKQNRSHNIPKSNLMARLNNL